VCGEERGDDIGMCVVGHHDTLCGYNAVGVMFHTRNVAVNNPRITISKYMGELRFGRLDCFWYMGSILVFHAHHIPCQSNCQVYSDYHQNNTHSHSHVRFWITTCLHCRTLYEYFSYTNCKHGR